MEKGSKPINPPEHNPQEWKTVMKANIRQSVKCPTLYDSGNDKMVLLVLRGKGLPAFEIWKQKEVNKQPAIVSPRSTTWSLSLRASVGIIFTMGNSTTRTLGWLLVRQLCSTSQSAPSRNRPETKQPVWAEKCNTLCKLSYSRNQFKTTVPATAVLGTCSHDKTHYVPNCSYTEVYLPVVFAFTIQLCSKIFFKLRLSQLYYIF